MEKRKYSRITEKVKFFYKTNYIDQKEWLFGWIGNLSLGGAFAKISRNLPVGSQLSIRIPLQFISRGTTVCNLTGSIVRHAEGNAYGDGAVGIAFAQDPFSNEKAVLAGYVKEKCAVGEQGKAKVMASGGFYKSERKMQELMNKAAQDLDKSKKKKGFFSKLFGNG